MNVRRKCANSSSLPPRFAILSRAVFLSEGEAFFIVKGIYGAGIDARPQPPKLFVPIFGRLVCIFENFQLFFEGLHERLFSPIQLFFCLCVVHVPLLGVPFFSELVESLLKRASSSFRSRAICKKASIQIGMAAFSREKNSRAACARKVLFLGLNILIGGEQLLLFSCAANFSRIFPALVSPCSSALVFLLLAARAPFLYWFILGPLNERAAKGRACCAKREEPLCVEVFLEPFFFFVQRLLFFLRVSAAFFPAATRLGSFCLPSFIVFVGARFIFSLQRRAKKKWGE